MNPWRKVEGSDNTSSGVSRAARQGGLAGPPCLGLGLGGDLAQSGAAAGPGTGQAGCWDTRHPFSTPVYKNTPHNPPAPTCGSGGMEDSLMPGTEDFCLK